MERRISINNIDAEVDPDNNNSTAPSILDGPYWLSDTNRPRTRRSPLVPRARIAPMASAMDADLSEMMTKIIQDPDDGPVRESLSLYGIVTAKNLLQCTDLNIDALTYDDSGTTKDINMFKKNQVRNLRDFLLNRINKTTPDPLDPSKFSYSDVIDFVADGSRIAQRSAPVPPSVVNAIQAQSDLDNIKSDDILIPSQHRYVVPADRRRNNIEPVAIIIPSTPRYVAPVGSQIHTGCLKAPKKDPDVSKDLKTICILEYTSTTELDNICHYGNVIDNECSGASTLEDVNDENRSSDDIDSDATSIVPKKVPPDPYDRDNPVSSHCNVDNANLCNDRVKSVDIIVQLWHVAADFGVTDNPLDKDVFFHAGSEQLKVTTNSALNVAAARSIGNGAKRDQNAVFDDNDPHLADPPNDVSDSILSLFDNVEKTLDASIADLLSYPSADDSYATATDVASVPAAAAMQPILTDCNLASDPIEKKTIAISVNPPRPNVKPASMFFYTENDNVAESSVAAAATMDPFSDEAATTADYEASAAAYEVPAAAAVAAMTIFYAENARVTESNSAVAAEAATTAAMVIQKSTIIHHSTEHDNGIVFHDIVFPKSTAAAAAEADNVFALVDAFVPSDHAVRLAHAYCSNNETSRYDKRIYSYAFAFTPIISMRFNAFSVPRNAFHHHSYCQLSEQDAVEALPIFMPQQLVHHRPDRIACESLCFDHSKGKAHCIRLDHSNITAPCNLLENDVDGYPIILHLTTNHAESMTHETTPFHPYATPEMEDLIVHERTFLSDPNYDGTVSRHEMYHFLSLDASERSTDITHPKGTQDKDLLGEDISQGRDDNIVHDRSRPGIYRVTGYAYSSFYHLLGSLFIRKIINVNTRRDISNTKQRKDFGLCRHLDDRTLFMVFLAAQRRIYRPTKHIAVIAMTTEIEICSEADTIGMLGIPVHTRLPNAGIASKNVPVKLRNICDEPNSFDSSPNDMQHANGEPGYDNDVLKDGEPYDKQPRHGRNRKSDRDESARKRAETTCDQYVRKQTVVDSIAENSQGTHFVRDAKSDGEKKQQSQSLYSFEKLTIPLLTENGEPSLDDGRLPLIVMAPNPDELQESFETFMIPLLTENGEPSLDNGRLPLIVMAPNSDELQDRNFLTSRYNGEQVKRARTVESPDKHEVERFMEPALAKLKVKFERSDVEDIMTYSEVLNCDSTIKETHLLPYVEVHTTKIQDQDAESTKHETQVDTKNYVPSFSQLMKLDNSPITRLYTTTVVNIDRPIQNLDDHKKDLATDDTLSNRNINEPLYYKEDNPTCSSESQEDKATFYRFHPLDPLKHVEIITGHIEMRPQDKVHCRSTASACIEWKNGERLYNPPNKIGSFESALKYQYGFDIYERHFKDGAYTFDWDDKGTSSIDRSQNISARKEKKLLRLAKQAGLRSFRTPSKYVYGFQIRKDDEEALELDVRNHNTKQHDSTALEMSQTMDYDTRIDKDEFYKSKIPDDVPINDISYMYGDNESMINSSTVPHARSHKRRNIVSYHLVRSMGACGYISMNHLRSEFNVSDELSQHWGYKNSYESTLKTIFHHIGNVGSLIEHDVLRDDEEKYDPVEQPIVYLKQMMGSVKTRKLLVGQG